MPNMLRNIFWLLLSLLMVFVALTAFWVFLLLLGIGLVARLIYLKIFKKEHPKFHTWTVKFHTNKHYSQHSSNCSPDEYTTVIDADDMNKEYKIPKLK